MTIPINLLGEWGYQPYFSPPQRPPSSSIFSNHRRNGDPPLHQRAAAGLSHVVAPMALGLQALENAMHGLQREILQGQGDSEAQTIPSEMKGGEDEGLVHRVEDDITAPSQHQKRCGCIIIIENLQVSMTHDSYNVSNNTVKDSYKTTENRFERVKDTSLKRRNVPIHRDLNSVSVDSVGKPPQGTTGWSPSGKVPDCVAHWVIWSRRPRNPSLAPSIIISPRAHPPPNILRQALDIEPPPRTPPPSSPSSGFLFQSPNVYEPVKSGSARMDGPRSA